MGDVLDFLVSKGIFPGANIRVTSDSHDEVSRLRCRLGELAGCFQSSNAPDTLCRSRRRRRSSLPSARGWSSRSPRRTDCG
jgi:hypothetical protein